MFSKPIYWAGIDSGDNWQLISGFDWFGLELWHLRGSKVCMKFRKNGVKSYNFM